MERKAMVAGQFYPAHETGLREFLKSAMPVHSTVKPAVAVVMPHAGYVYSGEVAAQTIAAVKVPATAFVLGPNHTGQGRPFSLMSQGTWRTPLGSVRIDEELAAALLRECALVAADISAHLYEHAIEVELPFLQYCRPDISFVPLVVSEFRLDHYQQVGEAIARVIQACGQPVLLVASSDLTHYESQEIATQKDTRVIDAILALDPERMIHIVRAEHVSMCGFAPVAVMLYAARVLGARRGTLAAYRTSGDVTGDYERVVGYAGIVIQ